MIAINLINVISFNTIVLDSKYFSHFEYMNCAELSSGERHQQTEYYYKICRWRLLQNNNIGIILFYINEDFMILFLKNYTQFFVFRNLFIY